MRKHTFEELERFFAPIAAASSRWARDTSLGSDEHALVFMPPGEGSSFRPATNDGQHRCVLPSCGGLLRVAAGAQVVHHWRHRPGEQVGDHSPETIWHLTAKAALATFARGLRPDATVRLDDALTPSRTNKPNVWVRWAAEADDPPGDIAFEAQHSALTTSEFTVRTDNYVRDGVVAVWLFSHLASPELLTSAEHPDVRLRSAHQAAAQVGPLRWFNPDEQLVATAFVRHTERPDVHRNEVWDLPNLDRIDYVRAATRFDRTVSVALDQLGECTLDERGLHTDR